MVKTYNPYEVKQEQDIRHYGAENPDLGPNMDHKYVGSSFNAWADRYRMMTARTGLDKSNTYPDGTVHNGGAGTVTQYRQVGPCVYAQAISPAFNRPISSYAFPPSPSFPYIEVPATPLPESAPITCQDLFDVNTDMSAYEVAANATLEIELDDTSNQCWAATCADLTTAETTSIAIAAAADFSVLTPFAEHTLDECWTDDLDCTRMYKDFPVLDPWRSASGEFPDCWDVITTCDHAWAADSTPEDERKVSGSYPDCWLSSAASEYGESIILCSDIQEALPSLSDDIATGSANYVVNDPDGTKTVADCFDTAKTCTVWWGLLASWDDIRKAGVDANTDGDCWDFSPTTCAELFIETSGYEVQIVTPTGTKKALPKPGGTYPDCWSYQDDVCNLKILPTVKNVEEFAAQIPATTTYKVYKYLPCGYGNAQKLWLESEALRGLNNNDPFVTYDGDAIASIAVTLESVDIFTSPKGKSTGVIEYNVVCTLVTLADNTEYQSQITVESCGDVIKTATLNVTTLPPQYFGALSLGASIDGGAVWTYRASGTGSSSTWGSLTFPYACPTWSQPLPPTGSANYNKWYPFLTMLLYKTTLYVGTDDGTAWCSAAYRTAGGTFEARNEYCTTYPSAAPPVTTTASLDPVTGKPTINFTYQGQRGGLGTYAQCLANGNWSVRILSEGAI